MFGLANDCGDYQLEGRVEKPIRWLILDAVINIEKPGDLFLRPRIVAFGMEGSNAIVVDGALWSSAMD
jgi:hypothetical protein